MRCSCAPPPSAPRRTKNNMIQLGVDAKRIQEKCVFHAYIGSLRPWAELRADFSYMTSVCTLVEKWGSMCLLKKGPELKSVLRVLRVECVRGDTMPEWGDWGSLELAEPLWLLKTFTTMATGGSLCSWVKGQLGEFSLSANRKAFVTLGTQGWLQLVPCEIAHTAKAI